MSQYEASGCHTSNNILPGGILARTIFTSAKNTVLKKMYREREHINFSPNNATRQTSYGSFILAKPLDFTDKQYVPCALNVPLTGTGSETSCSRVLCQGEAYVDFGELKEEYATTSLIPGKRGKEVGRGATAVVKIMCQRGSARQSRENPYVAVKEFRRREKYETNSEYERKVKSEFTIAVKLTHPNVVKTLRLCRDTGRWSYVMEYCPFGDLYSLINKNYLKEQDKLCFAKQLLQGVAYLHESGVAHCDIKLENILLSEKGHIKITDFGLCQIFDIIHPILPSQHDNKFGNTKEIQKCSYGVYGSLPYMAPEILAKNGYYDPRMVDMWSCAIVCFALWHRGTPWKAATPKDPNYSSFISSREKLSGSFSDSRHIPDDIPCKPFFASLKSRSIRKLFLQMLHPISDERPTARYVLSKRAMKSVGCCCPDAVEENRPLVYFDAAGRDCHAGVSKMTVQTIHNHFPSRKKY